MTWRAYLRAIMGTLMQRAILVRQGFSYHKSQTSRVAIRLLASLGILEGVTLEKINS